jgi:hypothetical protein
MLTHLEVEDRTALEAKVELEQREVPEVLGEQPLVSDGDFDEPIVGDHEGPNLHCGQVVEAQGRLFAHAELIGSQQAAMTGNDIPVAIDQDWNNKAEDLDTVTDLPDCFSE